MRLSDLLEGTDAEVICAVNEVEHVVSDSRKVRKGDMFIASRGERNDGNDYIEEALAKGASVIVTDGDYCGAGAVRVRNSDIASARIFRNLYGRPDEKMNLVAVTGTNGKTTTSALVAHIISKLGGKVGLCGTSGVSVCGNSLDKSDLFSESMADATTPSAEGLYKTLSVMRMAGCEYAVVEASSHSLDRERFTPAEIKVGIFTNLSPEHLDYHGDMESYYRAKMKLLKPSRSFAVNCDDKYGRRIFEENPDIFGISAKNKPGMYLESYDFCSMGEKGIFCKCRSNGSETELITPMCGRIALYNSLCALAGAMLLGCDMKEAADAVSSFKGVEGRMEKVVSGEGKPLVIIDYAHTPDALEKALVSVKEMTEGRVIVLFGCGGDRDETKRTEMGRIAGEHASFTVITGDNPRSEDPRRIIEMIEEGIRGKGEYTVIEDRGEALAYAVEMSEPGDIVLCCGKGHEKYIIDKCGKHFFDEKAIIKEAVIKKYGSL